MAKTGLLAGLTKKQLTSINKLIGGGTKGASALADALFSSGSLGRVSTGLIEDKDEAGNVIGSHRVKENEDLLNAYKSSLQGYSAPELQAQREQATGEINNQYLTQMSQAAKNNAKSMVRGGASTAGAQDLNQQRIQTQGNVEQNIFMKNADEKYRRLGEYGNVLGGMRADELSRQQFNLGQVGAEKSGQYGTFFGALGAGQAKNQQQYMADFNKKLLDIYKMQINKPGAAAIPAPQPQTA